MDYAKHYWALIERAKCRELQGRDIERHHIIPRCMGGGNEPDNLARLTSPEHFIAHLLLAKMHPDNAKLAYALTSMARRAGCGYSGAKNKRYAQGMARRRSEWLNDWRRRRGRIRKKKIFTQAQVDKLAKILAPRGN